MTRPQTDPQQRILDLLSEVLSLARQIAPAPATAQHGPRARKSPGAGIYPHTSKYNPWRAYAWDRRSGRMRYLGAFPSIAKARAAQRAFAVGNPITEGTKAALRAVA